MWVREKRKARGKYRWWGWGGEWSSMVWWKDAEPGSGPLCSSSSGSCSATLTKSLNFPGPQFKWGAGYRVHYVWRHSWLILVNCRGAEHIRGSWNVELGIPTWVGQLGKVGWKGGPEVQFRGSIKIWRVQEQWWALGGRRCYSKKVPTGLPPTKAGKAER